MPITLEGVFYTYAPGTAYAAGALKGVSLTVPDGAFVGIMGKTGCGKSTMIQLIAGLLQPSAGRVLVDGQDINEKTYDRRSLRRRVGVVFQHPEHQLFETTVERDVAFGAKRAGMSREEIRLAVREALEAVGFDYEAVKDRSPLSFSGGEKRRIAIAGVLAVKPGILILDEPIAGLDPLGRQEFLALLRKLNRQGTTVLMISHNADAIAECADRVVILENGEILLQGSAKEVLSRRQLLQSHGIGLSRASQIAALLEEKGVAMEPGTVRYEDLLRQMIAYGRRRQE